MKEYRVSRIKEIIGSYVSWLPPLLMSIPLIAWLVLVLFKYEVVGVSGRILTSLMVSTYIFGAVLELRWLLAIRYAWSLIKGRTSVGFRDLIYSLTSIALYPLAIGSLLALNRTYDGKADVREYLLTLITLGLWLSYTQKRMGSKLSGVLARLEVPEESPKPFTI